MSAKKFYYITPNPIGVNDFLILGRKGSEEAAKKHNASLKILESEDPNTINENVRSAINDGADLVIVIGFEFGDIIPKVAAESPDVQFLTIDFCPDNPAANVHCAVFREYEAAYLIGGMAGLLTKTNEVMQVSDRATVLRDGRVVTMLATSETSPAEISRAMVGRDVMLRVNKRPHEPGEVVLNVSGLHVENNRGGEAVCGVSFDVRAGEIVGIADVAGNGQNELVEALVGLRLTKSGRVMLRGREITSLSIGARRAAGMAYMPEDCSAVGLSLDARADENLLMGYEGQPELSQRGWLNFNAIGRHANRLIERFAIKAPSPREAMVNLSGGNRQKAVLARELSHQAALLIAEQPTWSVDVGSIEFIHQRLLDYRENGHASRSSEPA